MKRISMLIAIVSLSFLPVFTMADGQKLTPFEWHYDVSYSKRDKVYDGIGSYSLQTATRKSDLQEDEDRYEFTALLETHKNILKSVDTLLLRYDENDYVVPIRRHQKNLVFKSIPFNKKIAITPHESGSYYDTWSAILFLVNQLQQFSQKRSDVKQWKLWLADDNKWEEFYLADDERINTPIGEIDSYVIIKKEDNPEKEFKLWIAKEGFYLAKFENKKNDEKTFMIINKTPL